MRAIVIPLTTEVWIVLVLKEDPEPERNQAKVVIQVKAFGINNAECTCAGRMRQSRQSAACMCRP